MRKQPSARHAARRLGRRRRDAAQARARWCAPPISIPYQMHGSVGTSCAVADVQGGQRDDLVGDAGACIRMRDSVRDAARPARRQRARDLHARLRLLRHQRRRHGVLRCGAAVAGGRPAGARAAHAQGRDGVGELRAAVRHRSARRPRRRRHDRRVGLRGVVAAPRRPARLRHARQRRHRLARRLRAGRRSRRGRRRRRRRRRSTTAATPRRPTSPAASAAQRGGTGTVTSERVLSHRVESPFFTGPLRSPEPAAEHVRARVLHGRDRRARQGRSGRVPAAAPERSALDERRARRGEGRELGRASVAAAARVAHGRRQRPRLSRACSTKATTATSRWSPRSRSNQDTGEVAVRRLVIAQDCGPDLESRRHAQPDSKAARCRA